MRCRHTETFITEASYLCEAIFRHVTQNKGSTIEFLLVRAVLGVFFWGGG